MNKLLSKVQILMITSFISRSTPCIHPDHLQAESLNEVDDSNNSVLLSTDTLDHSISSQLAYLACPALLCPTRFRLETLWTWSLLLSAHHIRQADGGQSVVFWGA